MSASNFLELEILDHILSAATYTPPATVFIALHTADPTETGAVGEVPTTNNYSRLSITNNVTNWPAASAGSKSNGTLFTFATPGVGGWGLVTHFSIWDAVTAGNCLFVSSALAIPKNINQNDVVTFGIGTLTVTAD